jgi:hypothetical protein
MAVVSVARIFFASLISWPASDARRAPLTVCRPITGIHRIEINFPAWKNTPAARVEQALLVATYALNQRASIQSYP